MREFFSSGREFVSSLWGDQRRFGEALAANEGVRREHEEVQLARLEDVIAQQDALRHRLENIARARLLALELQEQLNMPYADEEKLLAYKFDLLDCVYNAGDLISNTDVDLEGIDHPDVLGFFPTPQEIESIRVQQGNL